MFTPPPFPANYPPGRVGGKVQGVIRLHRVPFGNKHRERIRADQLLICRDVDILVGNHILNGAILLYNGILHQHTVAHNSTLLDLAATEQHAAGAKAIQLHTGGMCHLDAEMTRQGLEGLGPQDVDLVVLENVGNLVCPAEFDTGAVKNAMILSVPEGDDKPLKYPLMFQVCDVVLINKIDVLPYFDFDMDKCREYIAMRNPNAKVIPICAKTGEGIAEWTDWLREQVKAWQA